MNNHHKKTLRLIALAPSSRGIGFAVLETPVTAIDWGVRRERQSAVELFDAFQPDVLIVEDTKADGCRKRQRVKQMIASFRRDAEKRDIAVRPLPRLHVNEHFEARDKVEIAQAVAKKIPALRFSTPSKRQTWDTEDHRMPIFEAFALIIAAVKAD